MKEAEGELLRVAPLCFGGQEAPPGGSEVAAEERGQSIAPVKIEVIAKSFGVRLGAPTSNI
jgi:hypothetical protein